MRFFIFIFVFILFFNIARASVEITEIMYDLEGADSGREWVEIYNNGTNIDIVGWKFFENGTNHGLTLIQGSEALVGGGIAIIADNTEKFLLDWPSFSGTLFDSAFSLSNTGEELIIRDADLIDQNSVTYSAEWGAAGDGNSLQKINGEWGAAAPTPGKLSEEIVIVEEEISPHVGVEAGGGSGSVPPPPKSKITAFAGEDRAVLAGAGVFFHGIAYGVTDEVSDDARFLWNFGDGAMAEGRNATHVFWYPGVYVVTLDASLAQHADSDSLTITVVSSPLKFSEIKPSAIGEGGWIEIENTSSKTIDAAGFGVSINNSTAFHFSKNSMIAPRAFVVLNQETLGFSVPESGTINFLYPNKKIMLSSSYSSVGVKTEEALSFDGDPPAGGWQKTGATPGAKNKISISAPPLQKVSSLPTQKETITKTVTEENFKEASVVSTQENISSVWSETKWLLLGLGGGIFFGAIFFLLRRHFKRVLAL